MNAQHTDQQMEKFEAWVFNKRRSEINRKYEAEVDKYNKRKLRYTKFTPL